MQRDTYFTLEEVTGTSDIYDPAYRQYLDIANQIPEASSNDVASTLQNLRFLRIPGDVQPQESSHSAEPITCILTEAGAYSEVPEYVAVSYCWDSHPPKASTISHTIFDVSIKDEENVRPPRCPHEVLVRAVVFAFTAIIPLIWIDQECINQKDPVDVQNHLRCMHRIFQQAKKVAGLVSFSITDTRQMSSVAQMATLFPSVTAEHVWTKLPALEDIKTISYMTRLLKCLQMDRWFTRTWVLQERFSATGRLVLLMRTSPELKEHMLSKGNYSMLHAKDVALDPSLLILGIKVHMLTVPSDVARALRDLHAAAINLIGYEDMIRPQEIPGSLQLDEEQSDWQEVFHGFAPKRIFRKIETCDNRVVSDRVAILANIVNFDHRLPAADWRSYSSTLLALFQANDKFPLVLVRVVSAECGRYVGALDVGGLIDHLVNTTDVPERIRRGTLRSLTEDLEKVQNKAACPDVMTEYKLLKELEHKIHPNPHIFADFRVKKIQGYGIVPIIPTSVTVGELLEGIIAQSSRSRATVSHEHGEIIVQYAIDHGQLPKGAEFVSFWGSLCWSSDFVEKHFKKPY